MKVAIDLRPLQLGHQNRGIGSYLLNILQYFPATDIEYVFVRYDVSDPVSDYDIGGDWNYNEVVYRRVLFSKKPIGALKFLIYHLSPKYRKIKKHRPDIFFQPDYLLGIPRLRGTQNIVVAYDLIPLLFRNMYLPRWSKYWHLKQIRLRGRLLLSVRAYYHEKRYRKGIKNLHRADKIISISNTTTNDLINVAHVREDKITTIYLAPSFIKNLPAEDSKEIRKVIEPIKKKYLLFIGGTDSRRKASELVHAFNLLNARGHDMGLVFAGNEFVHNSNELDRVTQKAIESSSYKDNIHLLGKISENDKRYILENSFVFVYPTLYEGFGLPLLESMSAGRPVITFSNSATNEIAGKAALYTDTDDGIGIYKAVVYMQENPAAVLKCIKLGKERSSQFSWNKTGDETMATILGEYK